MQWAALIAWILTALGGLTMFFQWAGHGGLKQTEGIRAPRLLSHMLIAVAGSALWVAYLVTDESELAWTAVSLLTIVALLGVSMLVISSSGRTQVTRTATPAEASFPIPIVLLHGALGGTTLLLTTLSAAGIGT